MAFGQADTMNKQVSRLLLMQFDSSVGGADYADWAGITFGSTCTCGGVPEPSVLPDEGRIIGQRTESAGIDNAGCEPQTVQRVGRAQQAAYLLVATN
jgi:hypothetical protein